MEINMIIIGKMVMGAALLFTGFTEIFDNPRLGFGLLTAAGGFITAFVLPLIY